MSYPTTAGAYEDCYAVLDRALANANGTMVRVASRREAEYFRARLHRSRAIERNVGEKGYDKLFVTLDQDGEHWYVVVKHRTVVGEIIDL